ncbi:hypothetical protein ACQZ4R_12775 [Agrobacterium vitis]
MTKTTSPAETAKPLPQQESLATEGEHKSSNNAAPHANKSRRERSKREEKSPFDSVRKTNATCPRNPACPSQPILPSAGNSGSEVATIKNVIQFRATVQHPQKSHRSQYASMSGAEVGDNVDLFFPLQRSQLEHKQQAHVHLLDASMLVDNSTNENPVQARIRARIAKFGLTEKNASLAAGLDRNYLRVMLDRPNAVLSRKALQHLALALECSEAWLKTGKNDYNTSDIERAYEIATAALKDRQSPLPRSQHASHLGGTPAVDYPKWPRILQALIVMALNRS